MSFSGRGYDHASNVGGDNRTGNIGLNSNPRKLLCNFPERRPVRIANHAERAKLMKVPHVVDAPVAGSYDCYVPIQTVLEFSFHLLVDAGSAARAELRRRRQ